MSSLAYKRQLERQAGLSLDGSGLSGADLMQASVLNNSNVPALGANMDGARLDQMVTRGAKDDFAGTTGNALGGRYPKFSSQPWTVDNTGFTINANACVYDGVALRHAMIDTSLLDNFAVRAKQTAITANGMRIVLRANAIGSTLCLFVERDQTANTWALINGSGPATINSFADATDLVANDVVECQVKGDNVQVFVNGVLRGTLTGAFGVYAAGSFQGFRGVIGSGFTVDDFYAYSLAG